MRKAGLYLFLCAIALAALFAFPSLAAGAGLTGPGTVRAGDTITLTFSVSGSGIGGGSGTISYDAAQVTLQSIAKKLNAFWELEFHGNNFIFYDNNQENPINGSADVFTAVFKVNSNLPAGTALSISVVDARTGDTSGDTALPAAAYNAVISQPKSGNANLKSLEINNAALSPYFGANILSYSAGTVEFSVTGLGIAAEAEDARAKVTISGNSLAVGDNAVKVTVTAENGAQKVYVISVTRKQDPDYKASDDATLSGISVDGFLLSPIFSPERKTYVVWLPYEVESVVVTGTASDPKARGVTVVGGDKLFAGQDNTVTLTCTAESGATEVYAVVVKRAAPFGAETSAETTAETTAETARTASAETDAASPGVKRGAGKGVNPWLAAALCALCFAAGGGTAFLLREKALPRKKLADKDK